MELQSWLLYHLVAVTDCNQGIEKTSSSVVSCTLPWTHDICVTLTTRRLILGYFSCVCLSLPDRHSSSRAQLCSPLFLFTFPPRYHTLEETVVYRCLTVSSSYGARTEISICTFEIAGSLDRDNETLGCFLRAAWNYEVSSSRRHFLSLFHVWRHNSFVPSLTMSHVERSDLRKTRMIRSFRRAFALNEITRNYARACSAWLYLTSTSSKL